MKDCKCNRLRCRDCKRDYTIAIGLALSIKEPTDPTIAKQLPLDLPIAEPKKTPRLGYRQLSNGLFEKCNDTGYVRETLDYEHFSEYPADLPGSQW